MAAAIAAGATISAFAAAFGTAAGATRLLFTLGRDRLLPAGFGRTTRATGSPLAAMIAVVIITTICVLALFAGGISAVSVFGDFGALGVLALLVVYLVTEIAAIRLFSAAGAWSSSRCRSRRSFFSDTRFTAISTRCRRCRPGFSPTSSSLGLWRGPCCRSSSRIGCGPWPQTSPTRDPELEVSCPAR